QKVLTSKKRFQFTVFNFYFRLEYSPNRDPFVYRLIYVLPITQECQLQLIRDEADVSHRDLPHTPAECRVWFPSQKINGHGLVIELTRLNVPCSRGFVHFSGMNMTQHPHIENTLVNLKSHKQTHLCGKLEELPEVDRHVYFPAPSPLSSSSWAHTRPAMHLQGQPVFYISYHLVDYCYNITFLTRNGSFELNPKGDVLCTFKIHLPYGNRVALKLWIGDNEATGSPETAVNFQDFRNGQEKCDGLLIQLQDGTSSWAHCTKSGDGQKQIEIVSRENRVMLKVRIRASSTKSNTFALKMSYRAEPVESVVGLCDFGWVVLRQFCIGAMEGLKLPWAQAEMECARKGGHLVSVRSDRDQHIIDNLLVNTLLKYQTLASYCMENFSFLVDFVCTTMYEHLWVRISLKYDLFISNVKIKYL
uniref:Uncharacterized protein LOC114334182 n=1 Tax=Diabrotica virgifera virgifera TaxID=50390 RepID=A0A6P7G4W2_DIAVI